MLTLQIDVAMTRRKLFCFVFDEHETLLWSGMKVGDAIAWLHDQGHGKVTLQADDASWSIAFMPRPE